MEVGGTYHSETWPACSAGSNQQGLEACVPGNSVPSICEEPFARLSHPMSSSDLHLINCHSDSALTDAFLASRSVAGCLSSGQETCGTHFLTVIAAVASSFLLQSRTSVWHVLLQSWLNTLTHWTWLLRINNLFPQNSIYFCSDGTWLRNKGRRYKKETDEINVLR